MRHAEGHHNVAASPFERGSEGYLQALERALKAGAEGDASLVPRIARLLQYAEQAKEATTGGEAHKYVLLNEGPQGWSGHSLLMRLLAAEGLGVVGQDIHLVPAPLLRATHKTGGMLMPMPLVPLVRIARLADRIPAPLAVAVSANGVLALVGLIRNLSRRVGGADATKYS